jgi:hypothetical protein
VEQQGARRKQRREAHDNSPLPHPGASLTLNRYGWPIQPTPGAMNRAGAEQASVSVLACYAGAERRLQ